MVTNVIHSLFLKFQNKKMTNPCNKTNYKDACVFQFLKFYKIQKGWCSNGIDIDHENVEQEIYLFF